MFVFIIYAAAVWALIVRDRRRWLALLWIVLGGAGVALTAWLHALLAFYTQQQLYLPVLRTLLIPFGVLVVVVGAFIAILPRTPAYRACRACRYDMSMLDGAGVPGVVEACPECGTRHAFDHTLTGPCIQCGVTLGHGTGERQRCGACGTIHVQKPRRIPRRETLEAAQPETSGRVLAPAARVMQFVESRRAAREAAQSRRAESRESTRAM
ncbi:MAG: hypothetical protein SFY96_04430 [Planctomycetota bacterium]|nr:hypothetical protein [Planctomycetota bacterium]